MIDKTLPCRLHRWITQTLIVLIVLAGFPLPLLHARSDTAIESLSTVVQDTLPGLTISDGAPKVDQSVRDPAPHEQVRIVRRPLGPERQLPQAQGTTVDTGGFSSVLVVDAWSGINNDPTISLDGRLIAFWSTADLPLPPGPRTDHVVINEVALLENVYSVEIFNGTGSPLNMSGWRLIEYDQAGQVRLNYQFPSFPETLPPNDYAMVYYWGESYYTDYPPYEFYTRTGYPWYGYSANRGGALELMDNLGYGIDFVRWGNSTREPQSATNWTGANPPAVNSWYGDTLGRGASSTDTDDGNDWCRQYWTWRWQNPECGNLDGNIETFMAEIGSPSQITFTEITFSNGSILGGFSLKPSISTDGSRVAFFSDRDLIGTNPDQNFEIFVYDVSSETVFTVTQSLRGANILPSIDEDGTHIAFVSDLNLEGGNPDGGLEIFVAEIAPDGSIHYTQVTSSTETTINDQPAINADGTRIAYISDVDGNLDLYFADLELGGSIIHTRVTTTGGETVNEAPVIDSTGNRIAFVSNGNLVGSGNADLNREIFWADIDVSRVPALYQVTQTPITITNDLPAIHPYGDRIAFIHSEENTTTQQVMLYYTDFHIPIVVATIEDAAAPSRPAVGGEEEHETYVAFAAGSQLYRVFAPLSDVYITKQASSDIVAPGQVITYTIKFGNWSTDDATNVLVTDTFPMQVDSPSFTYSGVSITETGWSSYPNYGWDVEDLSYGETGYITAVATVRTFLSADTQIVNEAAITTDLVEPFYDNNSAQAIVTVENVKPLVAVDDDYTVTEDSTLFVTVSSPITSVLANDIDPNNDPLTVTAHTQPTNGGNIDMDADGYFTYTPPPDFYGVDTFTYVASDGWLTDSAAVTITVIAVNDPPTFTLQASHAVTEESGQQVELGWTSAISPGGWNEDGQHITLTLVISAIPGLFSVPPTITDYYAAPYPQSGVLTYTPAADRFGQAVVTVTLHDNGGTAYGGIDSSDSLTFTITITPVNDKPFFTSPIVDIVVESTGSVYTLPWATVDRGGWGEGYQVLTFTVADGDSGNLLFASHPTIAVGSGPLSNTAIMTLTSQPNARGTAVVTVTIYDNGGTAYGGVDQSDTVTFTVEFNDRPRATDDGYTTSEDSMLTVPVPGVLQNDVDADPLTATLMTTLPPVSGTLVFATDGSFAYDPAGQYEYLDEGEKATVNFVYLASDGWLTDTATVTVTITGVNDAPVLDLDEFAPGKNAAPPPYEGIDPNKRIAPDAVVNDVDTDIAWATVTFANRPDGVSETLGCPSCGLCASISTIYNESSQTLLITTTTTPANYQCALRRVEYFNAKEPPTLGQRVFTVTVYDTGGLTDTAISTVTLINSPPVATDDLTSTVEGNSVLIDVLLNDDDLDDDPIWITQVGDPPNGTAVTETVGVTVMIRYTPDGNFFGTDVFTYTIRDLPGGTDTATVTVTVSGDNDPPVNTVPSGPLTVNEDQLLTFSGVNNTFSIADVDAYTNAMQVSLVATNGILFLGSAGSVSITIGTDGSSQIVFTGTVTDANTALNGMAFSPTVDHNGPATITIRTDDLGHTGSGGNLFDVDTVPIDVLPQPDAPRFTSTPVPTATYNVAYVYNITAIDPDGPGPITITAPVSPSWLVLVDNGDGTATLSGTPALSDRGIHNITLEARDATALVGTQVFTIEVLAPELSIAKSAAHPTPLRMGDLITYTVVVNNVGTLDATSVAVLDTLPGGVTYVPYSTLVTRGPTNKRVLDTFTTRAYSNNDGPDDWEGNWIENDNQDGSQSPSAGSVRVSGPGDYLYLIGDNSPVGRAISREVDLDGFANAILSFYYHTPDVESGETVVVEVSSDGGSNYTLIDSFVGQQTNWTAQSYDISDHVSRDTVVRFRITVGYNATNDEFHLDDVQVEAPGTWDNDPKTLTYPLADGTTPNLIQASDGITLSPGEGLTVVFQAVVSSPLADNTTIVNIASATCAEIVTPVVDTAASTVRAPLLSISKSAPATVVPGGTITYTVVVQNQGVVEATNVSILDTLPANTYYVSGSSQVTRQNSRYLDRFGSVSYTNSDDPTTTWSDDWDETNDNNNPASGKIWIATGELWFRGTGASDTFSIRRDVNLSGAASATLSFDYRKTGDTEPEDRVVVSVYDGSSWHTVWTIDGTSGVWPGSSGPIDISAYADANSEIRFQVWQFYGTVPDEHFIVDNVAVHFAAGDVSIAGGTPPDLVDPDEGYILLPGQSITATYAVTVDTGLGGGTPIQNAASVTCTEVPTPTVSGLAETAVTLPEVSFSQGTYSVGEGVGNAVITVTLDVPPAVPVSVDYATSNGTAQSGSDYTASSDTLAFPPGTTVLTFTVAINDDALYENNETVNLALSNPVSATLGTPGSATLTIVDNDPQPSLTISDVSVVEGTTGSVNAVFTVTLSEQSGLTVGVNFATANNSATTGDGDYTANSGSLVFSPGVTTRLITVVVHGDIDQESDETFYVNLSGETNATIADTQGIGTIVNDDHEFTSVADAWIRATDPDVNHGSGTTLQVRPESIVTATHTLIQFDISSIPSTTNISYAALLVWETTSNSGQTISVRRVLTSWVEGQATWNNRSSSNAWSAAGGDYDGVSSGSFAATTTGWREVEITSLVQDWIDETYENYGLLLRSTTTGNTDAVQFHSREGTNDPVLVIVY